MKTVKLICLALIEIVLVVLLVSPVCIQRGSHARAFVAWKTNPSAETECRWNAESTRLHRDMAVMDLAILGAIILNTAGLVMVIRRGKPEHNKSSEATSQ